MDEMAERAVAVAEAQTWIGTPYHASARVKGRDGGADCLTFLAGTFAPILGPIDVPFYPMDWNMHSPEERYLDGVLQFCDEYLPEDFRPGAMSEQNVGAEDLPRRPVLPGDVVMWKMYLCFSHGAIVTDWPKIIHAYGGRRCAADNVLRSSTLLRIFENQADKGKPRPRRFFTLKRWNAGAR